MKIAIVCKNADEGVIQAQFGVDTNIVFANEQGAGVIADRKSTNSIRVLHEIREHMKRAPSETQIRFFLVADDYNPSGAEHQLNGAEKTLRSHYGDKPLFQHWLLNHAKMSLEQVS